MPQVFPIPQDDDDRLHTLPADLDEQTEEVSAEEVADENVDELSDENPEAAEAQPETLQSDATPSKGLDAETLAAMEERLAERMSTLLETGLSTLSRRLQQSSRDSVRAQVAKALQPQIELLERLAANGTLSQDVVNTERAKLNQSIDSQVEERLQALEKEDVKIRPAVTSANQQSFETAALAVFQAAGLTPADPEVQALSKVRLTADFAESLKLYTSAVQKAAAEKAKRVAQAGKGKKNATMVDDGKGKSISVSALERELQQLMRQNGGSIEQRARREQRMAEIDKLLNI